MSIEILNRWTQAVVYRSEASDIRAALIAAVTSGADLGEANLGGANLRPIRDDFWAVLACAPQEIPALRKALVEGRVDGSTYQGACACLVGTIANARGCTYDQIPTIVPNASRPAEQFFLAIGKGDTPETSQFSRLAVEWLDDFYSRMKTAFAPQGMSQ